MPEYEVYATRWDDPHIVEELIPARGLSFSKPLSAHGECRFSATVEPGRSWWRDAISPPMSGIIVTKNGQPVWAGQVIGDDQSGQRTFDFSCREWGGFYGRVDVVPQTYRGMSDAAIWQDIITRSSAQPGAGAPMDFTGISSSHITPELAIPAWDTRMVDDVLMSIAQAAGGPEWRYDIRGTLDAPVRQLYLADRLGRTDTAAVLEYVEDAEVWAAPEGVPSMILLGSLFPVESRTVRLSRSGGNAIAARRGRQVSKSSTTVRAIGAGQEMAMLQARATATRLLAAGWPRMVGVSNYGDETILSNLQRHADADLKASAGITTGWSLVTLDGDPEWTQVPVGSNVRLVLDTDVYGRTTGPIILDTRVQGITVDVPDDGPAQITWDTATVLEVDADAAAA